MNPQLRNRLLLLGLGVALHLFLVPLVLSTEPSIGRDWSLDSSQVTTLPPLSGNEQTESVFTGANLVYVDETGTRASSVFQMEDLAYTNDRYTQNLGQGIGIFSRSGSVIARLEAQGAPYFSGNRLFVLQDQGTGFGLYTADGEFLWNYQAESVITGLAADFKDNVYVGLLNGEVLWFDPSGILKGKTRPGSGKTAVVYGLAWVESWGRLAVVSDLDPQSIAIIEPDADGKKTGLSVMERLTLSSSQRHAPLLQTVLDDSYIALERPNGFAVIGAADESRLLLPWEGSVSAVSDLDDAGLVVLALNDTNGGRLLGIKPDGRVVFDQRTSSLLYDVKGASDNSLIVSSLSGLVGLRFGTK